MTTPFTQTPARSSFWRYALSGLLLPGSLLALVAVLIVVVAAYRALTGQGPEADGPEWVILPIAFGVLALGGGFWARVIARQAGTPTTRQFIFVSALAYAALTTLSLYVLGKLGVYFVEEGHSPLPLHQLFTLLFVPTTLISATALGGVMGLALGNRPLAIRLAWRSGLAAALTFLAFNVLQDLLGRRVGGPNAAETATMITVTFVCKMAASMAMSVVVGRTLQREVSHVRHH